MYLLSYFFYLFIMNIEFISYFKSFLEVVPWILTFIFLLFIHHSWWLYNLSFENIMVNNDDNNKSFISDYSLFTSTSKLRSVCMCALVMTIGTLSFLSVTSEMENNKIPINSLFYHFLFFINCELSIDQSCFTRFGFFFLWRGFFLTRYLLHYSLKFHGCQ